MGTDIGITGRPVSVCGSCGSNHDAQTRFWARKEQAQERYAICMTCEKLTKIKTCELCGCFVIGKTKILKEKCPEGKW
jgi:hypothetical protein